MKHIAKPTTSVRLGLCCVFAKQPIKFRNTTTPTDLLPLCRAEGLPLVYDVHHHRCNSDELSVEEVTSEAVATWNREPMFHISSPLEGWKRKKPRPHHDFIDVQDFPRCWRDLTLTVEVEAKAKEVAVLKLKRQLTRTLRSASRTRLVH